MLTSQRDPFGKNCELPERRKCRLRPRYETEDELVNGVVQRKVVLKVHDYAVPFTPQKGIECFAHDLASMAKRSFKVEHQACYLSNIGRNPIVLQQIKDSQESLLNHSFNQAVTASKKSKK